MAIEPICNRCGLKLTQFGGILLGPPDQSDQVQKLHLCADCYRQVIKDFKRLKR